LLSSHNPVFRSVRFLPALALVARYHTLKCLPEMFSAVHLTSESTHTSRSGLQLSDLERRHVLSQLPTDTKALAIASARIYHAPFSGREDSWIHSGLKGALVFGRNRLVMRADRPLGVGPGMAFEHKYWFRLIDLTPGKGVIWIHQVPEKFQYRLDKPFFHVFPGKTRMFGFRFDDDLEADKFYKKVMSQLSITALPSRKIKKSASSHSTAPHPKAGLTPLKPPMISSPTPGTFVHVSHVGYNDKGRVEASDNLEPGWTMILEEMQGVGIALDKLQEHGVSPKMVAKNKDFVEGFLKGAEARTVCTGPVSGGDKRRKTPHRKPVALT